MGCSSSKGLGLEHVVLTKKKDAGGFMTKKLDLKIQERFNVLAQGDKCMAEYAGRTSPPIPTHACTLVARH